MLTPEQLETYGGGQYLKSKSIEAKEYFLAGVMSIIVLRDCFEVHRNLYHRYN